MDALATDVTSSRSSSRPPRDHTRQARHAGPDDPTSAARSASLPDPGRLGSTLALSGPYVVFQRGQRMVMMDRDTGRVQRLPQEELGPHHVPVVRSRGLPHRARRAPVHVTEWHVRSLPDGDLVGTYPDGGDQVASISPDGRYLLTSGDAGSDFMTSPPARPRRSGFPERADGRLEPDGHVVTTSRAAPWPSCLRPRRPGRARTPASRPETISRVARGRTTRGRRRASRNGALPPGLRRHGG